MKKVTCQIENASNNINGIPFAYNEDGHMQAIVEDAEAELFSKIPGFTVADAPAPAEEKPPVKPK
jgi:hypothetical protein